MPWPLKKASRTAYRTYKRRRFYGIETSANGMLTPKVYEKFYEAAADVSHSNLIEIGAGHGASTIALALGMKEAGQRNALFTFEKGEGGSRSEYGSKQDNIRILQENLESYGVDDVVTLIDEHLTLDKGLPDSVASGAPFSLLSIDADGRLDRDFELLYEHLIPGAAVIIDDYEMDRGYHDESERYPLGGGKSYRTFCFTNYLLEEGFLHREKVIEGTFFGTIPPNPPKFDINDPKLDSVREHLENDRRRSLR